ncbi:hypothetical protein RI367_004946 [Sorochytrium milnesiophthora]
MTLGSALGELVRSVVVGNEKSHKVADTLPATPVCQPQIIAFQQSFEVDVCNISELRFKVAGVSAGQVSYIADKALRDAQARVCVKVKVASVSIAKDIHVVHDEHLEGRGNVCLIAVDTPKRGPAMQVWTEATIRLPVGTSVSLVRHLSLMAQTGNLRHVINLSNDACLGRLQIDTINGSVRGNVCAEELAVSAQTGSIDAQVVLAPLSHVVDASSPSYAVKTRTVNGITDLHVSMLDEDDGCCQVDPVRVLAEGVNGSVLVKYDVPQSAVSHADAQTRDAFHVAYRLHATNGATDAEADIDRCLKGSRPLSSHTRVHHATQRAHGPACGEVVCTADRPSLVFGSNAQVELSTMEGNAHLVVR